uniref:Uncharacterized protein n=1 Tax=Rheinheimera sp. BAL341 TaxID=1708203 RepID=A0A486XM69_9GAMM
MGLRRVDVSKPVSANAESDGKPVMLCPLLCQLQAQRT